MFFLSAYLLSCIFYLVESSHFRGGMISWKPTEKNQVRLKILQTSQFLTVFLTIENVNVMSFLATYQLNQLPA